VRTGGALKARFVGPGRAHYAPPRKLDPRPDAAEQAERDARHYEAHGKPAMAAAIRAFAALNRRD
jgi:hypothetical protein